MSLVLQSLLQKTLGELRDGLDMHRAASCMEQYGVLLQEFFCQQEIWSYCWRVILTLCVLKTDCNCGVVHTNRRYLQHFQERKVLLGRFKCL